MRAIAEDPSDLRAWRDDQAFCAAVLPRVSRTFSLSIEGLPDHLREAVRVTYLLCRIVDTIEDERNLDRDRRNAYFDAFGKALSAPDDADERTAPDFSALQDDGAGGELCRGAARVFGALRALPPQQQAPIRRRVLEMSSGMRAYASRADSEVFVISDLGDLERYCYFVAGTVGQLLTSLFVRAIQSTPHVSHRDLRLQAVNFGIGLQMINILKDVATDFERGISYLPTSLVTAHGVERSRLLADVSRAPVRRIVSDIALRARGHLLRAIDYTLAWPLPAGAPIRLFCTVPLSLGLLTLDEIQHDDEALRSGREPKIGREAVHAIVLRAAECAGNDSALRALFRDVTPAV